MAFSEGERLLMVRQKLFLDGWTLTEKDQEDIVGPAIEQLETEKSKRDTEAQLENIRQEAPAGLATPRYLSGVWTGWVTDGWASRLSSAAFKELDVEKFIVWADIAFGASQVMGALEIAELGLIKPGDDTTLKDALSDQSYIIPHDESITGDVNSYLHVKSITDSHIRLLMQDETGFKLVDEVVNQVSGRPNLISNRPWGSYCLPIFERRGAEFAATTYKQTYPIAEAVLNGK